MKVTLRNPSELRAVHRPRSIPLVIAFLLIGVVVAEMVRNPVSGIDLVAALLGTGVGILLFLVALRGSVVHLDAAEGAATIATTGPFSRAPTVLPLEDIRDVTLKTGRDRSRSRIVFVTAAGPFATTWHALRTSSDRETVEALRAWMAENGFALAPREGGLRVGDRIRVSAPDGQPRAWLATGEVLQGRVERFLPPMHTGSLDRTVIRLDRTTTLGGVEASWLLLTQRYDPARWFDEGEVYVVAYPGEPKAWKVGLDGAARALEGTGRYFAVRGDDGRMRH